jgi:hypothetical protein
VRIDHPPALPATALRRPAPFPGVVPGTYGPTYGRVINPMRRAGIEPAATDPFLGRPFHRGRVGADLDATALLRIRTRALCGRARGLDPCRLVILHVDQSPRCELCRLPPSPAPDPAACPPMRRAAGVPAVESIGGDSLISQELGHEAKRVLGTSGYVLRASCTGVLPGSHPAKP